MNNGSHKSNLIVEDGLSTELLEVLNSPEFDDEADLVIDGLSYKGDQLQLRFSIHYHYTDTPAQSWQLTVSDSQKERIAREWTKHIALYSQHPLLLDYTDLYSELYFKGTTNQYKDLFIDIYQAQLNLTGDADYIAELNDYPITPASITALCEQEYGLFARGSQTILMLYQQCLAKYGIHAYFVGGIKPKVEDKAFKLFELGDSYIIGKTFDFVKVQ